MYTNCDKWATAITDFALANYENNQSNLNSNSTLSFGAATHGLMFLTERDAQFIDENTHIVPFNAGQYLFLNCSHMQEHFKNIISMFILKHYVCLILSNKVSFSLTPKPSDSFLTI